MSSQRWSSMNQIDFFIAVSHSINLLPLKMFCVRQILFKSPPHIIRINQKKNPFLIFSAQFCQKSRGIGKRNYSARQNNIKSPRGISFIAKVLFSVKNRVQKVRTLCSRRRFCIFRRSGILLLRFVPGTFLQTPRNPHAGEPGDVMCFCHFVVHQNKNLSADRAHVKIQL